jgi:hypothetical protein
MGGTLSGDENHGAKGTMPAGCHYANMLAARFHAQLDDL